MSCILNSKAKTLAADAERKRLLRDAQIKNTTIPTINIKEQVEAQILNSDATGLLELLKKGKITSEQILVVYFKRAISIGLELELITEINFEEALAQAKKCDEMRKKNPSACTGALFGLPMSLKDCFVVKGLDSSGGLASRVFNPAREDGVLVKILKSEGAIPFVKSNVPQNLGTIESKNNIWGNAKNPWDKTRSAGGSSGGEAALIASRCSPLGLGNDIGGSLRIPGAMNGVVSFKPTAERVTTAGTMSLGPFMDNTLNVRLSTGPITKTVRDASLLMKALLSAEAHKGVKLSDRDPYYVRKDWQEDIVMKKQKLRIGYFKSLEFCPASIANQRAVEEAVQALKKRGYDLVEVNFPNIEEIFLLYFEICASEGGAHSLNDALQGETPIKEYKMFITSSKLPNWMRKPMTGLMRLFGEKRAATLVEKARKRNAYEFSKLIGKQTDARKDFFKTWEDNKLDAIMLPSFPYPAQKLGMANELALGAVYNCMLNVLNLPSGAVPISVVQKGEDIYPRENTKYHDMMYKKMAESIKDSVGLPVGVQIATLPWEDEKCMNIMLQLEEEIQFADHHPYPM